MSTAKTMTAEKLLQIHSDLKKLGVEIILDGGWGTDALLGVKTRDHKDIDFMIEKKDVEKVRDYFSSNGYETSGDENTWWHFILENEDSVIDIHVIEMDESGRGIYGPKENNALFPADCFEGKGEINGVEVRCLTAEYRVLCLTVDYGVITRTGYKLKDTDYKDIAALCKKFKIEIPKEYLVHWNGHDPTQDD